VDDHQDWREWVGQWARHYRDAFARHPAAIPALVAQTVSNPAVLRQYDALAVTLAKAGFRPSIVLSVSMLDALCLGAALDVGAPSIVWDQPGDRESALHTAIASAAFDGHRSEAAFSLQLEWII
jgi:hypothetical protein